MIVHKELIQKSEEWHKLRHGKIGGTTSSGLFVKSDTLFESLLIDHIEPFVEGQEEPWLSADVQRGNDLEPQARAELSLYTGVDFQEFGLIQSEVCSLLTLSPDGLSEDLTIGCEIKCPAGKAHYRMIKDDEAQLDYHIQLAHYFAVNHKIDVLYFASFRPEFTPKPLFVKKYTKDSLVNVGTKAKPVLKPIELVAMEINSLGLQMEKKIADEIILLNNDF